MLKPLFIEATTISDCWFQLIRNIFNPEFAYRQTIQKGSFENGQSRLQYFFAAGTIEFPNLDAVPIMPYGSSIPAPTTAEYIDDYFANYIMNPELEENETYKYASRILYPMPKGGAQLDRIIHILKTTPLTNQASLSISAPDDFDICIGNDGKLDPPCLREIDFKVTPLNGELILNMAVNFRSWDLWAGFPTNAGGLELLKQYVASEAGLKNGALIFSSAGLHIYGYQEEIAKLRAFGVI